MGVSKASDRYVGHSNESSVGGALKDAVNQALIDQNVADGMVEYEVVKVWGRAGGIAGFRDVWVEISVGGADKHQGKDTEKDKDKDKDKEDPGKYTTMAVGEEGGDAGLDASGPYTTLAVGEEGGDPLHGSTRMLGEEGGQA